MGFLVAQQVKNLPADAKDTGGVGLILLGSPPGGVGTATPPPVFLPENSIHRGAWRILSVGSAKKSQT